MVQRYELAEMSRNPYESYRCLEEDEDGSWVAYEDYAEMRKERDYWYETCLAAGLLVEKGVEQ